jgi:hypothetical protein
MTSFQNDEQKKSLLRWGGLSGIIGGVLFICAMAFVIIFIPSEPATLKEWLMRFPEIKMGRTVENLIYLTALLFVIPLFISMYMTLKNTHLPSALFGSVISIIGLTSMVIFATPHIAHSKISDLFHTLELSIQEQESVAILWQSTWGMFDAGLYIGFFTVPIGFILLGIAMYKNEHFGKGFGLTSQIIGILGFIAGVLQIVDPASFVGALSYFSLIFYSFIFGVKTYRVSKV